MDKAVHTRLSSFGLPGSGQMFASCRTAPQALAFIRNAHTAGLPVIPSGDGTNCAFLEEKIPAAFLHYANRSLKIEHSGKYLLVTAGAGLPWDTLVRRAVSIGHGHEIAPLSGIPGSCGAAPVQNIAAYGAAIADTLVSVTVIDLSTLRQKTLSRTACGFAYRTSIFNTTERGRYLITSITLRLRKDPLGDTPARTTRRNIIATRKKKLPDWRTIPNCGSFFKNPIVTVTLAEKVLKKSKILGFSEIPRWMESDGRTKFSAAWLIEKSGLKGHHWGKIQISEKHTLVLVNLGERNHAQLTRAIRDITAAVRRNFGVTLDPEPNLINRKFTQEFQNRQNIKTNG